MKEGNPEDPILVEPVPEDLLSAAPSVDGDTKPFLLLCITGLGVIFLMQLEQGILLLNLLTAMVGVLGLISKLRLGPLFLLLTLTFAQLLHRYVVGRSQTEALLRAGLADMGPFLLATGVLAYVIGHFRLQGLWHEAFPRDPRQRTGPATRSLFFGKTRRAVTPHRRPQREFRLEEVLGLLLTLPLPALAASWGCAWLAQRAVAFHDLPAWWMRPIWFLLGCGLLGFVFRNLVDIVRLRGMGPEEAQLQLQDMVWQETRGEQRRIQRWWTWKKLRLEETGGSKPEPTPLPLGERVGNGNNAGTVARPTTWGRIMRFWLRELAGWILVLFGLYLFLILAGMLTSDPPAFLEASPFLVIAIFVFRGGIHLLKVAVAARICLEARRPESAGGNREKKPGPAGSIPARQAASSW